MPVDSPHFRAVCGLFCATFQAFMLRRARRAARFRKTVITTRNRGELLLFVFVANLLLCCGDIEANPGPVDSPLSTDPTSSETTAITESVAKQIMECINRQGERFESSLHLLRDDLGDIKSDISYVRQRCDDIDERCERLEGEYDKLSSSVDDMKDCVNEMKKEKDANKKEIEKLTKLMKDLESEMSNANEEIDRLENFSRRNNLRMFGVPPVTDKKEDYDDCAKAVLKVLNDSDWSEERDWTDNDIARAHRVGPTKDNQPRTMIVRFSNWRDKLSLIKDKKKRENLQKEAGVRLSNDLTKRQSAIVAEARREGKAAYFKNGKLQIEPRRPDPRTYAEVAGTEGRVRTDNTTKRTDGNRQGRRTATEEPSTDQRKQDRVGRRSEEGDSPHQASDDNSSPVTQRRPSRAARNRSPSTARQTGLRSYLQPAASQPKSQAEGRRTQRQREQRR